MAPSLRQNETRSWTDSTAGREKMTHALNSPARSLQWENKGKRGRQLHTNSNTDFLLSTSGYSVAPETLTVAQLSSSCLVVNGSSSSVSEDNLRGRKQSKADIGLSTSYFRVTRLFLFFFNLCSIISRSRSKHVSWMSTEIRDGILMLRHSIPTSLFFVRFRVLMALGLTAETDQRITFTSAE